MSEKINQDDLKELKGQLENASKSIDLKEKAFLELEKSTESRFKEDIKGYIHHKKYDNIKDYVEIITGGKSKINCLVLEGEQGSGKSTIIKSMLKELKKDFHYLNSYTTALSFYKTIYNNRFKHIIFDDLFGIMSDEKGIAIIRGLTNTEKVRYVKYESTSDKMSDVPSNFIFEGSITILTNQITPQMDNSLMGRAIHRKINFTLQEKFELMEKIARFHYKDLEDEEFKEIIGYIRENVDETTHNFSFRSVLKIIEFYKHNKKKWKELADEELEKDEELVFVKSIMKLPIEKRNKKWFETTGKTIRTLQMKIKTLKNKGKNEKTKSFSENGGVEDEVSNKRTRRI